MGWKFRTELGRDRNVYFKRLGQITVEIIVVVTWFSVGAQKELGLGK